MSKVLGVIPARSLIWLVVVLAASIIMSLRGTWSGAELEKTASLFRPSACVKSPACYHTEY